MKEEFDKKIRNMMGYKRPYSSKFNHQMIYNNDSSPIVFQSQ